MRCSRAPKGHIFKAKPNKKIGSLVSNWESEACIKTLRPRQNDRYFVESVFKFVFLNANFRNLIHISLKFIPKGSIDSKSLLG